MQLGYWAQVIWIMLLNKGVNELEIQNVTLFSLFLLPCHLPIVYEIVVPPCSGTVLLMPMFVLQSLSRLSSIFPISYFIRLVLKVFTLAHRQEWQEFTCTQRTFSHEPPAPMSQPLLLQEPHMLRSLVETDLMSVFTSSWWRKFCTWKNSEICQNLNVG